MHRPRNVRALDHDFDSENESETSSLDFVELGPPEGEGPEQVGQFGFTKRVR